MNELIGLSLFANVGIAEALFEENGVQIVVANELIERRAQFYREVYPNTNMICGDIADDDTRTTIVEAALAAKVNFIIATPPCQGMSVAGNRDPDDARNQLIFYAIDVIKRVKPKFIMLENVPRQLKTKIKIDKELIYIPDYIKRELGGDYTFNSDTLAKARNFGVPQIRERNFYLLVDKSLGLSWEFPETQEEVTLQDAIGYLPSLDPQLREGLQKTREVFPDFDIKAEQGAAISKWHHPPVHPWRQVEWMMHTPTGKSAIFNERYFPQKKDGTEIKAHHNHYRRMSWDKPARTITMFNGFISTLATVHPGRAYQSEGQVLYSDARVLSVYELMIVMSIPLDWPIPDWVDASFLRAVIGEGIPSKMAIDIVNQLQEQLKNVNSL
ncbi:MAG: DNA cytosine methyltransferase [Oscillospiraceae bacterium]